MKRLHSRGKDQRRLKRLHASKYHAFDLGFYDVYDMAMSDFGLKVPESINSAEEIVSLANKIEPMEESKESINLLP